MRFYTKQHKYYCGIDLHARTMFICILDQAGEVLFHRNKKATAEALLKVIEPYREDIVVAAECIFMWGTGWQICVLRKRSPLFSAMRSR